MRRKRKPNPDPIWLAVKIREVGWILGGRGEAKYWGKQERRRNEIFYWSIWKLKDLAKNSIWVEKVQEITAKNKEECLCQIQNLS